MNRVLVIDDDQQLTRALGISLRARGYHVEVAADGACGLAAASKHPFDVVVVDLGLPDMDGVDIVRGVRGWSGMPIIVLSARETQGDKVEALDAGADDYVTKPFGMDELLARLRAALRRRPEVADEPTMRTDSFVVDLAARRVTTTRGDVRLTPTEWHLLEVLVRNTGKLVSQRQLLREVWGPGYGTETNYLRVYVAQLRRKLEPDPARPRHILTEPGMGYRLLP
jgi:two-component system, OmpR family, KDP operon response regulator KdpE